VVVVSFETMIFVVVLFSPKNAVLPLVEHNPVFPWWRTLQWWCWNISLSLFSLQGVCESMMMIRDVLF
tara:strand:+ start:1115 stop:1318 length:204 start_codon:yes stop_codon:yes gene_type:complete